MTCKDCLYFKRCVVLGVDLDMHHSEEADKNCRHFKNKADYVEVKHGEWVHTTELGFLLIHHYWNCSLCGAMSENSGIENYCPNCGAKMDGEKNDFKE